MTHKTDTQISFKKQLQQMNACEDAIAWVGEKTLAQAWSECERGDWMLWFAQKQGIDLRILTLAKARCAKLVVHLMKDKRSRKAVEVAEKYGLGYASDKELSAASAAASAASAAYAAAAYAAAAAAAYAAAAADAAAAAAYADAAADAAAAYADAAAAAYADVLRQCADICRETIKTDTL